MIATPDQRLRVFVSSTLGELAEERDAARKAIESLRLTPVMFELSARPHPPRQLYSAYLEQSDVFVGIYAERYGWIAPDMDVSGLEDEYRLSQGMPRLLYVKRPAPEREAELDRLLDEIRSEGEASYKAFSTPQDLGRVLAADLAVLVTERFRQTESDPPHLRPAPLPAPPGELVGRERDTEELVERLDLGAERLITLTGPGGVGKTSLALAAAGALIAGFEGRVLFVPLDAVPDASGLRPAIARAIGLHAVPGPKTDPIADALGEARTLIVLDNFEHLRDSATELPPLLAACPGLSLLVTSRSVLGLREERQLRLAPLGREAARLFAKRAMEVAPDLGEIDEGIAAQICAKLDGLPLAIELAAGLTKVLSAEELLARIEAGLEPAAGTRDLPERQRTLRATLEWSHSLLSDQEKVLFRRLAVFHGGFDLPAAEATGANDHDVEVPVALSGLIDQSLVHGERASGRVGFSLLETVRDFAGELLDDAGEREFALRAHARFYAEFATSAREGLRSADQAGWCERLDADRANLLIAIGREADEGDAARAAEAVWALWPYFMISGPQDGRPIADRLIHRDGVDERALERARAARGLLAFMSGDLEPALADVQWVLPRLERRGDADALGHCLGVVGLVEGHSGDVVAGTDKLREALRLHEQAGDAWGAALARNALLLLLTLRGDAGLEAELATALRDAERLGVPEQVSMAHSNLARDSVNRGAPEEALGRAGSSLEWLRPIRHRPGAASVLETMAEALAGRPEDQEAAADAVTLLAMAETLHASSGFPAVGLEQQRVAATEERLRGQLPAEQLKEARRRGLDAGFDDAVEAGLARARRARGPSDPPPRSIRDDGE